MSCVSVRTSPGPSSSPPSRLSPARPSSSCVCCPSDARRREGCSVARSLSAADAGECVLDFTFTDSLRVSENKIRKRRWGCRCAGGV